MALDLEILERKLDEALTKETPESLMKFLLETRAEEMEAERKELIEALKVIERLCDSENPTHEYIWRITDSILKKYNDKKNNN